MVRIWSGLLDNFGRTSEPQPGYLHRVDSGCRSEALTLGNCTPDQSPEQEPGWVWT
jgi:hypothetical protein